MKTLIQNDTEHPADVIVDGKTAAVLPGESQEFETEKEAPCEVKFYDGGMKLIKVKIIHLRGEMIHLHNVFESLSATDYTVTVKSELAEARNAVIFTKFQEESIFPVNWLCGSPISGGETTTFSFSVQYGVTFSKSNIDETIVTSQPIINSDLGLSYKLFQNSDGVVSVSKDSSIKGTIGALTMFVDPSVEDGTCLSCFSNNGNICAATPVAPNDTIVWTPLPTYFAAMIRDTEVAHVYKQSITGADATITFDATTNCVATYNKNGTWAFSYQS